MAAGNTSRHDFEEASMNRDSYIIPASSRIQDLKGIYTNPEESSSVDLESTRLQMDLNSGTPNKYPNAPHSSPIDLQNDPGSSVFNRELVKCLNELPLILLSVEERTKECSQEISGYETDSSRSLLENSASIDSNSFKGFQYHYENADKNRSIKTLTVTPSGHFERYGISESLEPFFTNVNNRLEKLNLLRIDSIEEFNTDFHRSDNTSIIANCASDESDLSLEDIESLPSDESSRYSSRDRIEFEALALDSTFHPSRIQRFQRWKTRGRNKRALSLDEMKPSKLLNATDFSATPFELTF